MATASTRVTNPTEERPLVGLRDLPIAGRGTRLVWRKRRYRCSDCARTFTATHEQLPTRQRVTARFRARLAERVVDGAAHGEVARDERTSRYQVARAFGGVRRGGQHAAWRPELCHARHRLLKARERLTERDRDA